MKPKVSIVIPTYNHGRFVTQAVESALGQTYKNLEVVVVNDASTDDTHQIIKRYKKLIKYIKHPQNKGFAEAMNTGVKAAGGKYFLILSADDLLFPRCIEEEVEVLEKNSQIGLVFAPVILIDEKGKEIKRQKVKRGYAGNKDDYLLLITGNYVNLTTALVRRDMAREAGLFDPRLRQHPDWDLWLRIAYRARFAYVPKYLAKYRQHQQTLTAEVRQNFKKIGPEKRLVLRGTLKRKIPPKIRPFVPLLYLDALVEIERTPTPLAFLIFLISVATSRGLRRVWD